ncbi:LuxR C-terminal-related transcriptional regulator [Maricurvus nonylphenolicus]|uniref:LuxR C-terminal-related transcriptional regulator n=1 Tax=Maricurvus nonylphenolicus TaxID=1008307 RepID=UPI0036F29B8C
MTVFDQRYIVDLIKTRPPQCASGLVERTCLEQLQRAERSRINSLVLAPVGYGKSSLLVQFYNQLSTEGKNVAWLSISEDDADAVHFLAGVTASLQSLGGSLGNLTQSLLTSGLGVSYKVILTTLLNEILLSEKQITLFLDDLHLAVSEEFVAVVSELLEGGPENLHIVLASRTSLPVFNKMRARLKLVEVSSEDLKLSYDEAEQLLQKICPDKHYEVDLISLMERIDGWVNGLQIAALSVNAAKDVDEYIKNFSGSGRDFSEYIEHDIFDKLPAETQRFLVETSILEVLTPELCDVVTEGKDSKQQLAELQKLNLFLVTLDEERDCYRYHHFFRDFLRSKLTQGCDDGRAKMHRRVYTWCQENALINEAIDHMQSAGDWAVAGAAIVNHLEEMLSRNRLSTLKRWIKNLPTDLVDTSPALLLSLGWVAALERDSASTYSYIDQAKRCGLEALESLQVNIDALIAVVTVVEDDAKKISLLAQGEAECIPEDQTFFKSAYTSALVYALMYDGKYDQGHRLAVEQEMTYLDNNFRAVVYSHTFRGLGYRLSGNLAEALEQYKLSQAIAQKKFGDGWIPFSVPNALMAEIYYEWGDFETAINLLKNQEVIRQESSVIEPLICAYQIASRLAANDGDREKALQILAEGEALGRQDNYIRLLVAMLNERIRLLLAFGQAESAQVAYHDLLALGGQRDKGDNWSEVDYYVTLGACRYLLASGKADEALPLLSEQAGLAKRYNQHRHLLKLLLVESDALLRLDKQRSAVNRMNEAIVLGAKGRFQQSFLDAEQNVQDLIRVALERWTDNSNNSDVVVDADYIQLLRDLFSVTPSSEPPVELSIDLDGLDPLTPREVTLLQLLSKGLKNKELADEMHLSVHTIAWHLKNLYSKLGVDNRTAAVNVARHLNLD